MTILTHTYPNGKWLIVKYMRENIIAGNFQGSQLPRHSAQPSVLFVFVMQSVNMGMAEMALASF